MSSTVWGMVTCSQTNADQHSEASPASQGCRHADWVRFRTAAFFRLPPQPLNRVLETTVTETFPIQAQFERALGSERADRLLTKLDDYSNQPNAVKGAVKRPSDPELEAMAHAAFAAASPEEVDHELDSIGMWGLLTLAARADVTILDRLPASRTDNAKVATIRRAAVKYQKGLTDAAADD